MRALNLIPTICRRQKTSLINMIMRQRKGWEKIKIINYFILFMSLWKNILMEIFPEKASSSNDTIYEIWRYRWKVWTKFSYNKGVLSLIHSFVLKHACDSGEQSKLNLSLPGPMIHWVPLCHHIFYTTKKVFKTVNDNEKSILLKQDYPSLIQSWHCK